MNIGGIGNTGIDYTRYNTRQTEQEQEQVVSAEEQMEQAATVQGKPQAESANPNAGQNQAQTGQAQSAKSAVAAISGQIAQALESDDDSGNQTLINKANAGSELTKSELSQLKEIDPSLYSQAVKAEKARAELREQMKQSPSTAYRNVQSAVSQNNGEDEALIRKALTEEYRNFSAKYDQAAFHSIF